MANFDISGTVNNILSSRVADTAQEVAGNVIITAADMAGMPGVDLANLPGLPGENVIQKREFNPFDPAAARTASIMASKLIEIAERAEGTGVDVAVGAAAFLGELVGEGSGLVGDLDDKLRKAVSAGAHEMADAVGADALAQLGLRQQALRLFVTHYRPAHDEVTFEPLDQREPNLVSRAGSQAYPAYENKLSFWREDAQLNDHHGRWHDVYPLGLRPTPPGQPRLVLGDRNGELFAYMHMQMLARYDAERFSVDLPAVRPFGEYREAILEGYYPGDKVGRSRDNSNGDGLTVLNMVMYRARPTDMYLADLSDFPLPTPPGGTIPGSRIEDLERSRDALLEAAREEYYQIDGVDGEPIQVSTDNFGNTIEASVGSVDVRYRDNLTDPRNFEKYGNLHGNGHSHFAYFDDRQEGPSGVMVDLSATCRDPIFWRWHKHVDTIIGVWRERLGEQHPHDFADGPPVTVRSQDIIVCRVDGLPAGVGYGELGAEAFEYSKVATGKNPWDTDFLSNPVTVTLSKGTKGAKKVTVTQTAELLTEMRTRTIRPRTILKKEDPRTIEVGPSEPEEIDYLSHDDFAYFIRLENRSGQKQKVTIRIFLAPEAPEPEPWVDDYTKWIEMDRFQYQLEGSEHAVVFRPAWLSAVIRKPAIGHEELEGTKSRDRATTWCDCGWPYSLLLPRGTKDGLEFRLLVMLSSDDLDMADTGEKCTSMSYCGLQDEKYPDKRPMGYPFDRPLPDSIDSIIDKYENWAARKIKIRCRNL